MSRKQKKFDETFFLVFDILRKNLLSYPVEI